MAYFRGDSTDNRLDGTSGNDEIRGLKGDDELFGNGGNDRIFGNKGADTIDGGAGDDELAGGQGADTFVFGPGHGNDVITGFRSGVDSIDLSALGITGYTDVSTGFDDISVAQEGSNVRIDLTEYVGGTIVLKNFDLADLDAGDFVFEQPEEAYLRGDSTDNRLDGASGNDEIRGLKGDDELFGNGGNDKIFGNAGDDTLMGGADRDWLFGGKGRDTLSGGQGDDWLQGGSGADTFVFYSYDTGVDLIDDFTDGKDLIDLQSFGLTGFADVSAAQDGGDVRIDLTERGGGTIVLNNFDIADFDAGDFLF